MTYNAADQVLTMTHDGMAETRTYNERLQLTRMTIPGQMDLEYRYSATQNNGQITSMKNWINSEEVNYRYDALGRLSSAVTTGPEWGLSFTSDGFGNKTAQTVTKGSAPTMSIGVDSANHVVGHTYDANGNTTSLPGVSSMTWDSQGRMMAATTGGSATDAFSYNAANERILRLPAGASTSQFFLRGIDGRVLSVYSFNSSSMTMTYQKRFSYFAGKRVGEKEDRQATVQNGSRFYPYGEESPGTAQDADKYATYWRDGNTGFDYAINRYYTSGLGRFLSPDPYRGSAGVSTSGSWNRYAYVGGDPVGKVDPSGLLEAVKQCIDILTAGGRTDDCPDVDAGGGGGGGGFSLGGLIGGGYSGCIADEETGPTPGCPVMQRPGQQQPVERIGIQATLLCGYPGGAGPAFASGNFALIITYQS